MVIAKWVLVDKMSAWVLNAAPLISERHRTKWPLATPFAAHTSSEHIRDSGLPSREWESPAEQKLFNRLRKKTTRACVCFMANDMCIYCIVF